jgi:hypothetical protein
MFNRTNLTLSARSLSNRLNLGTRSFALVADVKNGDQTLRTRHTHHDVLREGMVWYDVFPNMPEGYAIPSIPGSFSQSQQCQPSGLTRLSGRVADGVRVEPDPRPASLVGRPEPCVRVGVAGAVVPVKPASKRAARRAAKAAAALSAASVGK